MRRRLSLLTRPVRHAIAVPLLEGFRVISGILPHAVGLRLGATIGGVVALVDRKQRREAIGRMMQAGLSEDPATLHRLGAGIFQHLGRGAVEALHALNWTPEQLRDHVDFEGVDRLKVAQAQGRGLILVSAHLGNWELLGRAYYAHTGEVLAAVMAAQTNDLVTRWLIRWRQAQGQTRLLPGHETLTIVRHLRGGGSLIMLADQDSTRSRGLFVDFFGRPAYTPAGPAYLARRLAVPLVPIAIVRDPRHPQRHRILLDEPIRPDSQFEEEADIRRMTQAYTGVFEGWIRQYPAQWVWIHDRWRHRPGQKIVIRSAQRRS